MIFITVMEGYDDIQFNLDYGSQLLVKYSSSWRFSQFHSIILSTVDETDHLFVAILSILNKGSGSRLIKDAKYTVCLY